MITSFFSFIKALPSHEKKITIPTLCTLLRIALVPCIVAALIMHAWAIGFCCFLIAAFTDLLDGLLARWYNEHTLLGALLDPLADKILIVSTFVTLACVQSPLFVIPWWFVGVVLIKEIMLLIGALFIIDRQHNALAPTLLGKYAMAAQVSFIIWLFVCYFFAFHPLKTYQCSMIALIILVVAALIDYWRRSLPYLSYHR